MKNILVPTDFSPKAHSAMIMAKKIAARSGGTVHLFHVLEPLSGYFSASRFYDGEDQVAIFTQGLTAAAGREMANICRANRADGFDMDWSLATGDVYEEIKKRARALKADLVVIGDKGVTDADEFFLGGITQKTVQGSSCPVITVKAIVDDAFDFKNIVFATDLERDHQPIVTTLKAFQELYEATIHIVKVNTRKKFKNDIDTKVALRKMADRHELENYTLNTYSHEDEEFGIVYFADEVNADLIAFGLHEKSAFDRLISGGSIVSKVPEHTFRPVLTLNLKAEKANSTHSK